jgi:aminocarboxymuconate-semialdehyde decarboxylase
MLTGSAPNKKPQQEHSLVIDVHTAFVPPEYVDLMVRRGKRYSMRAFKRERSTFLVSDLHVPIYGKGTPIPVATEHGNPEARLRDMDRMGVDVQALTPPTNVFHYWQPPELGAEIARVINDATEEIAGRNPHRFIGVGIVPLQNTKLAIAELHRMVGMGLRAVEIGSSVNGEELDSPRLFPFFECAAGLDLPVFIHGSELPDPPRFEGYSLVTLVGIPMATTIAAIRLIFSGTLDRIPELNLWLSHAGGVLPYLRGRLDHGYAVKSDCRTALKRTPGEWLDRLYYDTIAFHTPTLRYLVDMVGSGQIMLGSDYPFDDGESDPVTFVQQIGGLSSEMKAAILGGNAARLLKYKHPE